MKNIVYFFLIGFFMSTCATQSIKNKNAIKEVPVVIANDSLEYEVIIFDVGFSYYLSTRPHPMSYYTVAYLENKNRFYVSKWNNRFRTGYKHHIYENEIDYQYTIHYGLEVNYKLYNYFKFVELKYKERF